MTLDDWRMLSEIAHNASVASAVLCGGIWTYYKFVKWRLFTPKIELAMVSTVTPAAGVVRLVGCEIAIKNIGTIQLRPSRCVVAAIVHSTSESTELDRACIYASEDILPFSPASRDSQYYIDPGETSFRTVAFSVSSTAALLGVRVEVDYNVACQTVRTFLVRLNEPGATSTSAV